MSKINATYQLPDREMQEKIVALVLGELEPDQSEQVRQQVEMNSNCQEFYNTLLAEEEKITEDFGLLSQSRQAIHDGIPPNRSTHRKLPLKYSLRLAVGAAAAVFMICLFFWPDADGTGELYGMLDVPQIFKSANTIYMKGTHYFPVPRTGIQSSMQVEYWLDLENARWHVPYPGYTNHGNETIDVYYSEMISDGNYQMVVNHKDKSVSYSRLTDFQRKLLVRKNVFALLNNLVGIPEMSPSYQHKGHELIEDTEYEIWEKETAGILRIKSWLDPVTGQLGRVRIWTQSWYGDGDWWKKMDIDVLQRNISIPDHIFSTEPPEDYDVIMSKESAPFGTLFSGGASAGGADMNLHICFVLEDGSILLAWSSILTGETQANYFSDLEAGAALPKLPYEIHLLEGRSSEGEVVDELHGYHITYTRKDEKYYEWSLYVLSDPADREAIDYYQERHNINFPIGGKATIGLSVHPEMAIDDKNDFDKWVLGAMGDLSDTWEASEAVTYEEVMEISERLRRFR